MVEIVKAKSTVAWHPTARLVVKHFDVVEGLAFASAGLSNRSPSSLLSVLFQLSIAAAS
jgi:hypothetical protein